MKTRVLKTKSQMLTLGFKVGGDPNGHWWITRNGKVVKSYITTSPHPYGKSKTYRVVGVYVPKGSKAEEFMPCRCTTVTEHALLWIWFMGDIPDGMDVDHIDGCGQNNHLYNLRLITHQENIQARGVARNQYTKDMTDEEILKAREDNTGKFGHKRGRPSKKLLALIEENEHAN